MTAQRDILDRFWEKVDQGDDCWVWLAAKDQDGYGRFTIRHHVQTTSHRFAYELFVGPTPDGLVIDHLCRNRACCNPTHLEPVTSAENVLRGDTLPARNLAKTHCPKGHPYDAENTISVRSGKARLCRECHREHSRRSMAKQREKKRLGRLD